MENKYLERVANNPQLLKNLTYSELNVLAKEIRTKLVSTVAKTGGHLASNLGVVELTLALHKVFDSPKDQFVWDVGHQVYTHKLLTGRYDDFDSLRQNGGISGFPNPEESEHDTFAAGHSGTSISAAFGLSVAKKLKGDDSYTIAIIGDGSCTGGLVYEALNNAGRANSELIVILNDNEMSISQPVGSFAKYLAAMRTNRHYYKAKGAFIDVLESIPGGTALHNKGSQIKKIAKDYLYQSNFFEDLGFEYMGPVDGHNILALTRALEAAKEFDSPVLLHIETVKGMGYEPAELNPAQFHGISRFNVVTGEPIAKAGVKNYSDTFGEYLCELAAENDKICAITAAMMLGTGLQDFAMRYPNRFFDVGIAEEFGATFAGGLAKGDMIPVFAVYSTFLQRAYDELVHDVAMQNNKVILGVDRAGFVGEDGRSHQGILDVAFLKSIPGTVIYSPSSYEELGIALHQAVDGDGHVVAVRYPRGYEGYLPKNYKALPEPVSIFGKKSSRVTIVTYGSLFSNAVKAQEKLKEYDIDVKIIKLNRVWPIDELAIKEAKKSDTILFFEEGIKAGGAGETFATMLMEGAYKGDFSHIAVEDTFVHHASIKELEEEFGLSSEKMVEEVLRRV
ncbi:MAG: 1-deoxy-D-xylulose-5-phosphate synthase [Clostridia bacterium]|nr:1-deoxy-D-xylulose-5-phosphate synthase [Clostridia bacterium]